MLLLGYVYYKRGSIDRKQFVQRNIKREFSKFEKYKISSLSLYNTPNRGVFFVQNQELAYPEKISVIKL
jgi:hypothetical protein